MTTVGDDVVSEIQELWNDVVDAVDEVQRIVNAVLAAVPDFLDWVVDRVQQLWDVFVRSWQIVLEEIGYCLTHLGSPGAVDDTANAWAAVVGGPVSSRAAEADAGALLVDNTWTGTAADQYQESLYRQRNALTQLSTTQVSAVTTALGKMRGALRQFFGTAIGALVTVSGGLIAALAADVSIVGLPPGLVATIAALISFLVAMLVAVSLLKSDTQGVVNDLIGAVNANVGFPDGRWPTGTV